MTIYFLTHKLLPTSWSQDMLEVVGATVLSPKISTTEDYSLLWVLIVGPPGTGKTETANLVRHYHHVHPLDNVASAKSLVSGAVNAKGKKAKDLLAEFNGKCVVMKDMSDMLSGDDRAVKAILGTLTNVFDGDYDKGIGTAFDGPATIKVSSKFSLVGCCVAKVLAGREELMARLGSRYLCYRVPIVGKPKPGPEPYAPKGARKTLHNVIASRLREHLDAAEPLVLKTVLTDDQEVYVTTLARLVALARTGASDQRYTDSDDRPRYHHVLDDPEDHHRVREQFIVLLRGLAAFNLRTTPAAGDVQLVQRVALGTLPRIRADILALMRTQPVMIGGYAGVVVSQTAEALGLSNEGVRGVLTDMTKLGVLVREPLAYQGPTSKGDFYHLEPEFSEAVLGKYVEETANQITTL